jgi:hypothetical protein
MMARIGRLAGAVLAETEGRYYLVGDLKEPCNFATAGFEQPVELEAGAPAFRELLPLGPISLAPPVLTLALEGEALARRLTDFLVIKRNGSVSERLWRLVIEPEVNVGRAEIDARWLGELPPAIWQIVQDRVLKCT